MSRKIFYDIKYISFTKYKMSPELKGGREYVWMGEIYAQSPLGVGPWRAGKIPKGGDAESIEFFQNAKELNEFCFPWANFNNL